MRYDEDQIHYVEEVKSYRDGTASQDAPQAPRPLRPSQPYRGPNVHSAKVGCGAREGGSRFEGLPLRNPPLRVYGSGVVAGVALGLSKTFERGLPKFAFDILISRAQISQQFL